MGYKKDLEMARMVPDVDLIVGGHSQTFLFNGNSTPSIEVPAGPYPTYVEQPNPEVSKKVPVVQAYAYGKYIGRLDIVFDDEGDIISAEGAPVLLDSSQEKGEIKQSE